MKVLVCGNNTTFVHQRLAKMRHKVEFLVTGDDQIVAADWARDNGIAHAVFPSCAEYYTQKADQVRNVWMVTLVVPDLVLVFGEDEGMVKIAEFYDIEVERV